MDGVAVPGKLKLKKDSGVVKKKKKLTAEQKEKLAAAAGVAALEKDGEEADNTKTSQEPKFHAPKKTKAELAFERRQAALLAERVIEKAQMSHREKVEQFNQKMTNLSEFNDVPKVSWTK